MEMELEMKIQHLQKMRIKKPCNSLEQCQEIRCYICNDTGWEMIKTDKKEHVSICKCGAYERDIKNNKLKFANIPMEFKGHTVENFSTKIYTSTREKAELAKHIAKKYVEKFKAISEDGKGLYLFSKTKGSGKTRLAISIANDIIEKYCISCKFTTTLQLISEIKLSWKDKNSEGEQGLIKDIIKVPVLILDDVGVERSEKWIEEKFYSILNGRMIEKKVTIFTSNCKIEDLQLGDRIVSRIGKMALPVSFPEESIRDVISKEENNRLLNKLIYDKEG